MTLNPITNLAQIDRHRLMMQCVSLSLKPHLTAEELRQMKENLQMIHDHDLLFRDTFKRYVSDLHFVREYARQIQESMLAPVSTEETETRVAIARLVEWLNQATIGLGILLTLNSV